MAFLKFILFLACAACVVARQRSSKDSNKTPVGSTITSSLLHSILASADKKVAPNADDLDNPTVISLNIELTEIEKDAKPDFFTAHCAVDLSWNDPRLAWDANAYKLNIPYLPIDISDIWRPDIMYFSGLEAQKPTFSQEQSLTLVYPDGRVDWTPRASLSFRVTKSESGPGGVPRYTGSIILGSWAMPGEKIDVSAQNTYVETSGYFNQSSPYLLESSTVERAAKQYFAGVFPRLIATLNIYPRPTNDYQYTQ